MMFCIFKHSIVHVIAYNYELQQFYTAFTALHVNNACLQTVRIERKSFELNDISASYLKIVPLDWSN